MLEKFIHILKVKFPITRLFPGILDNECTPLDGVDNNPATLEEGIR